MSYSQPDAYELALAQRYRSIIPPALRVLAWIISAIFHPLLMLPYAYVLLAFFNPFLFGESQFGRIFTLAPPYPKGTWFMALMLFTCIIPLVGVLLMRGLGMVRSLSLETRDERKIPYVLAGLFYMSMVAQNSYISAMPDEVKVFTLGATIALFIAFFINLFTKISMHTVGIGGFLAMLIIIMSRSYAGSSMLFVAGVLACGLVGTARLLLGAHKVSDVYGGYFVGFLAQFVAATYFNLS